MQNLTQNQPEQIIQSRLAAIQRRMQIETFFRNLASYKFWGLFVVGVSFITNRFVRLPISIGFVVSLPLVAATIIAVILSLLRRTDQLAVARLVDRQMGLKERLSTSIDAIRRGVKGSFAVLQIRDAARVAQDVVPADAVSYTLPSMLKWLPLPTLLVGLSFFIPRMYEIPPPLTDAEQAALHEATTRLEQEISGLDDRRLAKPIQNTVDALRNKQIDMQAAQNQLSKLRDEIRAQKSQRVEDEIDRAVETVSVLGRESRILRGEDASEIASELQKLADQMGELTAGQRAELEALLKKLAQRLAGNTAAKSLTDRLKEIKTQGVSPETLKKIARSLLEVEQQAKDVAQLERILEEIKEGRKNIGLAGIEMVRKTGSVASGGDVPGEESNTGEAQGTQVDDEASAGLETQTAAELRLTGVTSDSQDLSSTTMQEHPSGKDEPAYMQYREVYLSAKRAYTEALERDRIPVRYQQRVKDYLDAIANPNR